MMDGVVVKVLGRRALQLLAAVVAAGPMFLACDGGGGDVIPPFWSRGGVVASDLDGDGRVDVAVAATRIAGTAPHEGFVEVYLQAADGTFREPVRYVVAVDPWGLGVGDLDGDGRPDLVAASPNTQPLQPGAVSDTGVVSVLRQDPASPGRFLAAVMVPTGGAASAAAIGPLTPDTRADVVVADAVLANGRVLLLAQDPARPGTLLAPIALPVGDGQGSTDVAVGPVDADGRADIVLATAGGAAVLYQGPDGAFAATLLAAGLRPQGVALADLDGDGRVDIVVANAGNAPAGGAGGASVTVLLQTEAGVFTRTDFAVPDGARRVVVADFDQDAVPDIAVVSLVYQALTEPSRVTVLRQSPSARGRFMVLDAYAGPPGADFIAAADVNGDGCIDIILDDGPSVMLQRPSAPGTFEAYRPLL